MAGYLRQGKILTGGRTDRSERYIEPTLLAEVDPDAPVMREEIFGPVLPVIPFDTAQQAVEFVTSREKPLALYYFGPERTGRDVLLHTSSGGACLNDTIMHIANEQIPFGGVGNSGMGRYHGRDSFDAFSHRRATVTTPTWIDPPFRYMPYRFFRWVKRILDRRLRPSAAERSKNHRRPGPRGKFSYLCSAGPLCRRRRKPGEESPGNTEHHAS